MGAEGTKVNTLMVMCGLPGSGKSLFANTYVKNHPDFMVVSTDEIRKEILGSASDQSNGWLVFMTAYSRISDILSSGKNAIFDATNVSHRDRKKVIKYFKKVFPSIRLVCACMKTPVVVCIERDSKRDRTVGKDVIKKMGERFTYPIKEEGWDEIIYNGVVL